MDMLSQGLGVYHMANRNTSVSKYPEDACSGTTACRHLPAIFPIQISRELTFKGYCISRFVAAIMAISALARRTRRGAPPCKLAALVKIVCDRVRTLLPAAEES